MKKFLLAAAALAVITAPALAADMPAQVYKKAPAYAPVSPIYTWTGFYIGGHLGGAFRGSNDAFGGGTNGRFIGGGQVGADYQFSGNWLVGVEGQYSYVDRSSGTTFVFPGGTFNQGLRGLASVTARTGYTWGPGLLYVKGGYAYADTRATGTGPFAFNNSRDGYTIGAGVEYMFAQNWSGKVEYQYYNFGRRAFFTGTPLVLQSNFREDEHTIKAGINYHFNFGSALAARY